MPSAGKTVNKIIQFWKPKKFGGGLCETTTITETTVHRMEPLSYGPHDRKGHSFESLSPAPTYMGLKLI